MPTTLNLSFKTNEGKAYVVRVNNPRTDLTRAEVEAAMQELIKQDAIVTSAGARMVGIESVSTTVITKSDILV